MGKTRRKRNKKYVKTANYTSQTRNQEVLFNMLETHTLVAATGPAGTGKTYTTCYKAAQLLLSGEINKIILTRANVSTGKSLGAVPGTLEEKMAPWMVPMLDVLREALGYEDFHYYMNKGIIEMVSLETIRGRSFPNAFIIVDEAQQLDKASIKAVTTRIGRGSQMVLMGDPKQSDINKTPYTQFCSLLEASPIPSIGVALLNMDDIVRSTTCANMVRLFHEEDW